MEIEQKTVLTELGQFPYYSKDQTLIVRNFSEPALDWSGSLDFAQRAIDSLGHQGTIMFITKGRIEKTEVIRARKMVEEGAKLIFVVTHAGNPRQVEKAPRQGRIDTARSLSAENIPVIMSMRPLILGVNTDPQTIESTLSSMGSAVQAITVGGLFVYDFTVDRFRTIGIELSDLYKYKDPYRENKLLPDYVPELVRRIAKDVGVSVPIYDHTTCASAYITNRRYGVQKHDRLAHWADQSPQFSQCNLYCPVNQRNICQKSSEQDIGVAISLGNDELNRIGFQQKLIASPNRHGVLLVKDGDLHLSELFFIEEKTGFCVENLPAADRLANTLDSYTRQQGHQKIYFTDSSGVYHIHIENQFSEDQKADLLKYLWKKTRSRSFEITFP
ncbi:MAG: hypothetical protein ACOX6N_04510 [Patescibacteria group bacterium]